MKKTWTLCVAFVALTTAAMAQQKPAPGTSADAPAKPMQVFTDTPGGLVPLRVQVVLSRFKGEKKISTLPYTLSVVSNRAGKVSMRMGVEVPIWGVSSGGGSTFSYRNVGTDIDCSAHHGPGGTFNVSITVSDTSVQDEAGTKQSGKVEPPSFRKFFADFDTLLRDGQTTQHTTATDPVSGEVLKIDVTVNVVK